MKKNIKFLVFLISLVLSIIGCNNDKIFNSNENMVNYSIDTTIIDTIYNFHYNQYGIATDSVMVEILNYINPSTLIWDELREENNLKALSYVGIDTSKKSQNFYIKTSPNLDNATIIYLETVKAHFKQIEKIDGEIIQFFGQTYTSNNQYQLIAIGYKNKKYYLGKYMVKNIVDTININLIEMEMNKYYEELSKIIKH